jgi:hypothetical protein
MRSLKYGCAAVCVALVGLAFGTSASADIICKVKEAPCSGLNTWASGTTFEAKIKTGTVFKFDGARHYTCTASTRSDRLMFNGSVKSVPAVLEPKSETYSGCSSPELGTCTAVTANMQSVKWFADPAGTFNGFTNAPSTATSITLNCSTAVNCKWLYKEQISHTYTGGSPAIEYFKAQYVRSSESPFGCGIEVIVQGEREITSPNTSPVYWSYG